MSLIQFTNTNPNSPYRKFKKRFGHAYRGGLSGSGRLAAIGYALGCGFSTSGAILFAAIVFGLAITAPQVLVAAGIMLFVSTVVNIKISWGTTPKYLLALFGRGFLKGLKTFKAQDQNGEIYDAPLSKNRKTLLYIALPFAACSGIMWGTFAYIGANATLSTFLSIFGTATVVAATPYFLPVAVFLFACTFIAITAMNTKEIADFLGPKDVWGKLKKMFSGQLFREMLAEDKTKAVLTIFFSVVLTALTVTALTMTLIASGNALNKLLLSVPGMAPQLASVVAYGISCFMAAVGEIGFTVSTALLTAKSATKLAMRLNGVKQQADHQTTNELQAQKSFLAKAAAVIFTGSRITNAIGYGLVAIIGVKNIFLILLGVSTASAASVCAAAAGEDAQLPTIPRENNNIPLPPRSPQPHQQEEAFTPVQIGDESTIKTKSAKPNKPSHVKKLTSILLGKNRNSFTGNITKQTPNAGKVVAQAINDPSHAPQQSQSAC